MTRSNLIKFPLEQRPVTPDRGYEPDYWRSFLKERADEHECATHPLFSVLAKIEPTQRRVSGLLRNYDAHAAVLRRLLLKTATLMPEEACGFVLENVRNEYGNGDPNGRHELQLRDLALQSGVPFKRFKSERIQPGVKTFISNVGRYYYPSRYNLPVGFRPAAVAAGAITATELLAVKEFVAMQNLFVKLNLGHHIWFDHINVEVEHSDESVALALYFIERHLAIADVLYGFNGVLNANISLYDGLLEALV
jgi:hypothetical protein